MEPVKARSSTFVFRTWSSNFSLTGLGNHIKLRYIKSVSEERPQHRANDLLFGRFFVRIGNWKYGEIDADPAGRWKENASINRK